MSYKEYNDYCKTDCIAVKSIVLDNYPTECLVEFSTKSYGRGDIYYGEILKETDRSYKCRAVVGMIDKRLDYKYFSVWKKSSNPIKDGLYITGAAWMHVARIEKYLNRVNIYTIDNAGVGIDSTSGCFKVSMEHEHIEVLVSNIESHFISFNALPELKTEIQPNIFQTKSYTAW